MNSLEGISVYVDQHIVGSKAVLSGDMLFISQESFDAMKAAESSDELVAVLETLEVIDVGSLFELRGYGW